MNELDRIKPPVLLHFPDKRGQDEPAQQGGRQAPRRGGKNGPSKAAKISPEELQSLVNSAANNISSFVQTLSREIEVSIADDDSGVYLAVRDSNTNQIIREIPVQEALQTAQRLRELLDDDARGILFDTEV